MGSSQPRFGASRGIMVGTISGRIPTLKFEVIGLSFDDCISLDEHR